MYHIISRKHCSKIERSAKLGSGPRRFLILFFPGLIVAKFYRRIYQTFMITYSVRVYFKLSDNFRQLVTKSNESRVGRWQGPNKEDTLHCSRSSARLQQQSVLSVTLRTLLDIRHDILPRRFPRTKPNGGSSTPAVGLEQFCYLAAE